MSPGAVPRQKTGLNSIQARRSDEPPRTSRHVRSRIGIYARCVTFQESLRCLGIWSRGGSIDRRQFKKVFHEREHSAIHSLDFRVRRFDDGVFIRSMGTAAVAEAERAGWQ